MGIQVRTYLDNVQYDEPTNIRDLQLSIIRDEQMHGIGFEASTMALNFVKDAAAYLLEKKAAEGLKANVICRIEQNCGDSSGWEIVIEGKVNMGQLKETWGITCGVSAPIESSSCEVLLNNRFDQQVDMDKPIAFDGLTGLPPYFGLGIDMELPTKALDYKTEGYVATEGDEEAIHFGSGPAAVLFVRPDFKDEKAANIKDSQLTGASTTGYVDNDIFLPVSPEILYNEPNQNCFSQAFKINGRLKGTINLTTNGGALHIGGRLRMGEINTSFPYIDLDRDVRTIDLFDGVPSGPIPFDWTIAEFDWTPLATGSDGAYFMLVIQYTNGVTVDGTINFDKESFFKTETLKTCPPTNTKAYLVHETLSRAVESVTNFCVRVKSSYYGRRDSEPFDFPTDGCGGLRFLTSGLKIRNAENPTFFGSPKQIIEGLQDIDNIGMGVESDPDLPGNLLLRIEDLDFFYRDQEIMRCDGVSSGASTIDINKSYSKVTVGYKKWETQANFGLDEFNSTREFRTALTAVNSTLDITSSLVAGEYPIEITRQQQYVDTSEADTTYDNEIFIILLKRITAMGYPYGQMIVEQGNVTNPENIFSPSSILNYGISPVRNLLRWYRSIAGAYPNITDSDNKLAFNSGTGNILAEGELSEIYGGSCRMENQEIRENQDVSPAIFQDVIKATPLWSNELINYDYPMSLRDYRTLKESPYGYISYQKGNGSWEKGWISEVTFKPFDGMGSFKLKKKWQ